MKKRKKKLKVMPRNAEMAQALRTKFRKRIVADKKKKASKETCRETDKGVNRIDQEGAW